MCCCNLRQCGLGLGIILSYGNTVGHLGHKDPVTCKRVESHLNRDPPSRWPGSSKGQCGKQGEREGGIRGTRDP